MGGRSGVNGERDNLQRSSASAAQFYMLNDEKNMQRKSYRVASVTAGDYNDDSRYAEWQQVNGSIVPTRVALQASLSELFSAYAVSLDADRASSAATDHALQLAATDLEYEVTRVKSPVIGRDLNPLGRGDGTYYCNGGNYALSASLAIRGAKPRLVGDVATGYGSSVNNRMLSYTEWSQLILKAKIFCPMLIVTCPIYQAFIENPCEDIGTSNLWDFCCLCMPRLCPECGSCSPTIGCCHYKLPGFGQYCSHRPPKPPPPHRDCKTTEPRTPHPWFQTRSHLGLDCCCIADVDIAMGFGSINVYYCDGQACSIRVRLVGQYASLCSCSEPGAIRPDITIPPTYHKLDNELSILLDRCAHIPGCDVCANQQLEVLKEFYSEFACIAPI